MSDNKDHNNIMEDSNKKFQKIRSWVITIIVLLIAIILISFFCSNCYSNVVRFSMSIFGNCNSCQIFVGVITGVILIPVAFSIQSNLRRNHFANQLMMEIQSNKNKMDDFIKNLDYVKEIWDRGEILWLFPKGISIGTGRLPAYLPNVAFKAFLSQGFHMTIDEDYRNGLALFYWYCDEFSIRSHAIESKYLWNKKTITKEEASAAYDELKNVYELVKDEFYRKYNVVNPPDEKSLGRMTRLRILWEATYIPWIYREIKNFFDLSSV